MSQPTREKFPTVGDPEVTESDRIKFPNQSRHQVNEGEIAIGICSSNIGDFEGHKKHLRTTRISMSQCSQLTNLRLSHPHRIQSPGSTTSLCYVCFTFSMKRLDYVFFFSLQNYKKN